ncbi:MAG: hypothetical protein RBT37_04000 [Dissulfurispiraceae bacterium]|jgi:N-acetylglucosamine-6-phosphate deacetylase|nr:hypothetical protein [Dissulfurispiraceae bacterium]
MKMIDLHTHGLAGFDTRSTQPEHLIRIAEKHGAKGVSEILLTLYPSPVNVMRTQMNNIRTAMLMQQDSDPEIAAKQARIIGIHLEGPYLNPFRAGALNSICFLNPDNHPLDDLIRGFEDILKIITLAPELDGATDLIKEITSKGIYVNMGHSDATYRQAEAGYRAGAKGVTHIFNAMRGIHHREPGLAGFGITHDDVYIELIADPFHISSEIIKMILSVKNRDRIILVSDSVKESCCGRGFGKVSDSNDKLLGGSMTIAESAEYLKEKTELADEDIEKFILTNPSTYLYGGNNS